MAPRCTEPVRDIKGVKGGFVESNPLLSHPIDHPIQHIRDLTRDAMAPKPKRAKESKEPNKKPALKDLRKFESSRHLTQIMSDAAAGEATLLFLRRAGDECDPDRPCSNVG